jgi:Leucine-rich repeat (LRR) protein
MLQGLDDSVGAHLSVLTSLQSLSLRGCRLSEEVLPGLASLSSLRALSLQGLQVAATRLRHLQALTALEDLNLHGLALGNRDSLAPLAHLSRLTTLNLRW